MVPGSERPISHETPEGLRYLWEITKNEVDAQFRIAERLDAKARGLFALTGVIFAAAQAFSLRADTLRGLSDGEHDVLLALALGAGVLALLALVSTAFATFATKDKSVESDPLIRLLEHWKAQKVSDGEVAEKVVRSYITLLRDRRKANTSRAWRLLAVQIFCSLAIIVAGVEFLFALHGIA